MMTRTSVTSFSLLLFIQLCPIEIIKWPEVSGSKIRPTRSTFPEDDRDLDVDGLTMARKQSASKPLRKNGDEYRTLAHPQNERRLESSKLHHQKQLLPDMYPPNQVPMIHQQNREIYRSNPYYSSVPVPFPYGSFQDVNGSANDRGNNGLNPRFRSGIVRGLSGASGLYGSTYRSSGLQSNIEDLRRESSGAESLTEDEDSPGKESSPGEEEEKYRPCGGECTTDEFLCVGSCACIPLAFRCDGDADCTGHQDELECGEDKLDRDQPCLEYENNIRCPRSGKCINKAWLCDGDDDCGDFSDETHCDGHNCTELQFECNNGLCIDKSWVCDGDNDCKDSSDENNCTRRTSCTGEEFHCNDGKCISITWKCDSESDCSDGSDESDCPQESRECNENEFECSYPRCVKNEFKCDGDDDCGDWSDEENCPQIQSTCGPAEFKCNGGRCIPEKWKCDEEIDCENGEDEENCADKKPRTCGPDEFSCRNGNCILNTWVCDNVQDCSKGEDEENCEQKCEKTQFNCAQHHPANDTNYTHGSNRPTLNCIGLKHVCDGKNDCPKGEDEKNCPKPKACETETKCQQLCVILPNGTDGCSCMPGFTLAEDNHSCNDVDECQFEYDPVCSQACNNTVGSFTCSCMKGYVLRPDGRTCKAVGDPPTLLFANRVDIRQVSLNNMKYTAILKDLHNAIAMDYHYLKGWIYWSDISMDLIQRSRLNGSEKSDLVKWGLKSPGGVTVDWVHDLLYWTDSGTKRVEVITLDGRHRSVIASNDLDKPRAIVTHPGEAYIFWTDWGPKPRIERAEMDGSNRKSIVTESVFWPNGLTLDYTMNRIYWADAKHHVIESATFEGTDRKKVITKGLPHPFAITLFEDAIYWTDWHTKSIATANKETGMGYKVVHSGLHFPMDIHSFHSQRQPNFTDHCGSDNGGCSHLCLPNRQSYQCVCPLGLQLQKDKRTCFTEPEKLLVFARKKDIRLRSLSEDLSVRNIDMVIPLDDVQSAVALAYDADTNQIYWSDVEGHRISRSYLNGSHQEIVIDTNLASPTGLSVDWVTKKLYWTDSGTNRIEASNLNGSLRTLLIWEALGKPRDIAVDPVAGYLYWSDWGSIPRIEKAGMDGSKRRSIVSSKLQWPNGLAIDRENGKLFWVDGGTKQIEFANLDGSGRKSLQIADTKLLHPFGLAVYEKKIYWSDWETNSIHTADKATGGNSTILRDGVTGLMDVRVFHRDHPVVASMCLIENGGCSHLCLLAPAPKSYSCACPTGIKLLEDGKTCAPGPFTSLIFAHRVDIRQISLDVPYRVDTVLPLPPMKSARSVDVDATTGDIYWSDTLEDVIMKASAYGENLENVMMDGLDNADGIAIDSSGRKLYWTDAGRNSIEVSELDGSNRKVLIWSELENPRAITLHYELGLMYWSDWGSRARIEQANMDGTERKTLISENLEWPNGLAVDHAAGRLYWNDGKRKIIESSDLQGLNRRTLVKDLPHPYGLVILGDYLYWTDWKTESIHKANKNNGNNSEVVLKGREGLMDIRLVQVKKVKENACGNDNGGCSHLCLRKPNGFSCACPTGLLLQNDTKTCNNLPSTYLLFSSKTKLIRISMDTPERWDVGLRIPDVHHIVAIDFHLDRELIFFSDVHLSLIRSVSMTNLTDVRKVVAVNLTMPDGLAVDWLADNIYWTDTSRKMVEVARIDGTCRKAIITRELIEPRAIALFPKRAYLFWTDWGNAPKIERSLMDGSQRRVIVGADLGFPNGLALDYGAKKLYWTDALKDRIEVSDLHGRFRVQLIPRATHPFGLAQYEEHIYWTDWYKKSVERADKTTGRDRTSVRTKLDVTEIRAVSDMKQDGWSPCRVSNGFCTHLCLYRRKDYVCACPDVPDSRKCYKDPTTRVPLRNDEEDDEPSVGTAEEGTKSDLDKIHGDPNTDSEDPAGPVIDSARQLLLVTMIVFCVLIIIGILTFLALFQRRRSKPKKYLYTEGKNVLTFSNPNYTTSNSSERGGSDKKPFLWKRLKYDRSQERVFGVQDDKVEDINLIDERQPSVPVTPPENGDSPQTTGG